MVLAAVVCLGFAGLFLIGTLAAFSPITPNQPVTPEMFTLGWICVAFAVGAAAMSVIFAGFGLKRLSEG